MMLRLMNEFVMAYDIDLNDHNIHVLMNDIVCELARKLGGAKKAFNLVLEVVVVANAE